jgi:hypothetical protein
MSEANRKKYEARLKRMSEDAEYREKLRAKQAEGRKRRNANPEYRLKRLEQCRKSREKAKYGLTHEYVKRTYHSVSTIQPMSMILEKKDFTISFD